LQFIGIDAHKDTLVAAAVDSQGRPLESRTFRNDPNGFAALAKWSADVAPVRVGVEGSGSLGRQASLGLLREGFSVVEVPPQLTALARRHERNHAKTDPIDALIIARTVLRDADLPAVRASGPVEDLRDLVHYRRELLAERNRQAGRLHSDLEQLCPGYQSRVGKLTTKIQLDRARRLLVGMSTARARLARKRIIRLREIFAEIDQVTRELTTLAREWAAALTEIPGVADLTAGEILAEVGDPRRYRTKAQFAMANGTAPLAASSGRTNRHRLNRGGNRQLNRIIHFIALTQTSRDPSGRTYYLRKQAEGRSKKDALRCLKRRISDRLFQALRGAVFTASLT
jgi:transposase